HIQSGSGTLGSAYGASVGTVAVLADSRSGAFNVSGTDFEYVGGELVLALEAAAYFLAPPGGGYVPWPISVRPELSTSFQVGPYQNVSVREQGLPAGTNWSASLGGLPESTLGSSLVFRAQSGSYPLKVPSIPGYVPASPLSLLGVSGTTSAEVDWTPFVFAIPFAENNLPAGTPWWVSADGVTVTSPSSSLELPLPNGTSNFTVGTIFTFVAVPSSGSVVVTDGSANEIVLVFSLRPGSVTGSVSPVGASLSVGGTAITVTGGQFNVSELPGSYNLTAEFNGFATQTIQVSVTAGNATPLTIELVADPAAGSPGSGPPVDVLAALIGVAAVVALALGLWRTTRRRRGA
ncbi:MAG: carboxypeptidase-like regulatory domain-containing protein, partial [Thermoplasmata archaeon]